MELQIILEIENERPSDEWHLNYIRYWKKKMALNFIRDQSD